MAKAVKPGAIEDALGVLAGAANTAREKAAVQQAVRALQGVFDVNAPDGAKPDERATPGRKAAIDATASADPQVGRSAAAARMAASAGSARGEVQPQGQGRATAQRQ